MRVFDLHADTMLDILNQDLKGETDTLARRHIPDYKTGEVEGLIYALWVPTSEEAAQEFTPEASGFKPQEIMMRMIARSFREFRETDGVEVAYHLSDFPAIRERGKVPVILGIEGFYGFNGDPDMVDVMYRLGFRHGMLTWNDDNEFAAGATFTGEDKGLTPQGIQVVRRMEELGMIIDVSHASEKTFWDIMENTSAPVIASHSNAWALCHHPRNLKDDQIRAIAERGGVIGMNTWWEFINERGPGVTGADVNDLAAHARYIADLVGPATVGCGFDFCNYIQEDRKSVV